MPIGTGKLRRPCRKCDKMFKPTGKEKLCPKCRSKNNVNKEKFKTLYFKQKALLDQSRDSATLRNWKILSQAYKYGKKVWGSRFTRSRLAYDMEMPYTTVLRCLSLDRASKKSWRLVNQKKLSVFRLAMICQLKSKTYHDEIVKLVVDQNLSTHRIKIYDV